MAYYTSLIFSLCMYEPRGCALTILYCPVYTINFLTSPFILQESSSSCKMSLNIMKVIKPITINTGMVSTPLSGYYQVYEKFTSI